MWTFIGRPRARCQLGRIRSASFLVVIALLTAACSTLPTPSTQAASTPTTPSVTSATPRPGSAESESGLKRIDQAALQTLVETTARELLIPGAVVLLRTPQGEFVATYGTTLLGAKIPPGIGTYFRIASNTKTMTAAVIMQLSQEGKLSLDDPVSKYVPGVPNGDHITIAQLLEMRSGLYNYTDDSKLSSILDRDPTKVWSPAEVLAIAFAHPANVPPGTAYEYNNTNYVLLGLIAEKVDGKPLAQSLQNRLFVPLHLQHTLLPAADVYTIPRPYSHGYLYGSSSVAMMGKPPYTPKEKAAARAGTLRPNDYTNVNHSFVFGAGGVISTANDLATWIEALVTGRVLNAKYQRLWFDSLQPEDPGKPNGQKYGYGIAGLSWGPNSIYFHGGETAGYNSLMGHDPNNHVTFVVWTNLTDSLDGRPTANTLMLKVLDQIYLQSPLAPPGPRASLMMDAGGNLGGTTLEVPTAVREITRLTLSTPNQFP